MEYNLSNVSGSIRAKEIYTYREKSTAIIFTKFLNWCDAQESNHYFWLGLTFFAQIGMALPLTAFSIVYFGNNNMLLWIIALTVNLPTLILNLAAMKTKVTLPILFFAWFIEASIILYCFINFLLH